MSPDVIDAMVAAGASVEVLAAAWKAELAAQAELTERRLAKDRERKRIPRNSTDSTEFPEKVSLEVSPQTPLPKPFPKTAPLNPPIPDWLPEATWGEFRKMRKAMRGVPFTPEAERRVIAKIEKLRAEGHCPEKLLSKAIERGHRSVFEDETTKADRGPRVELSADERIARLKADIAFFSKVGRDDDVRDRRRELAKLEAPPQVVSLARQIGRAA